MIRELAIAISFIGVTALLFLTFQIAKPPKKNKYRQPSHVVLANERIVVTSCSRCGEK